MIRLLILQLDYLQTLTSLCLLPDPGGLAVIWAQQMRLSISYLCNVSFHSRRSAFLLCLEQLKDWYSLISVAEFCRCSSNGSRLEVVCEAPLDPDEDVLDEDLSASLPTSFSKTTSAEF